MILLSIETSTRRCSVALSRGAEQIAYRANDDGNHAATLAVYIDELLAVAREQGLRLDAIVLSEGPGSYTGLRIGTAVAKGLCYGMDIPLLTLPTTRIIAARMEGDERIAMIDARRNEVYTATYDAQLRPLTPIEAKILEPEVKKAWFDHEVQPDAAVMGQMVEMGLAHEVSGKDIAYYEPFYLKEFIAAPSHVKGLN